MIEALAFAAILESLPRYLADLGEAMKDKIGAPTLTVSAVWFEGTLTVTWTILRFGQRRPRILRFAAPSALNFDTWFRELVRDLTESITRSGLIVVK